MQFTDISQEDLETTNQFTAMLMDALNDTLEMTKNPDSHTKEEFVDIAEGLANTFIQILTAGQMVVEMSVLTEGITDRPTDL